MQITKPTKAEVMRELKDYVFITFGLISYAMGWAAFLIPYQITTGGTTGIGAIIYYATGFPIQWSYFIINAVLMTFAIKILGPKFSIKTTFAIFGLTFFLWFFQLLVNGADGVPPQILGPGQDFMACLIGAAMCGAGLGVVFNCNGSTGGTDIIAMLLQKYAGIKFSTGIFLADCVVILSGLVVIGFGLGTGDSSGSGWVLTFYSLILIFLASRVVARVIDGASYDKLLFIISDENEKLRTFILEDLERSATFIKARGMYSEEEKDMIFLVVDRKEVHAVQRKVQEIDPKAFFVVTDAYDTYGEGFKPFPEAGAIQAQ